jgi:hypothetical protein
MFAAADRTIRMTGEDDSEGMSPEERRERIAAVVPHMVMNPGDRLRALDLADAVRDGDAEQISDIIAEVMAAGNTIGDGAARTMNLLLAYLNVSLPLNGATITRLRQQIANEEFGGITKEFGDPSE